MSEKGKFLGDEIPAIRDGSYVGRKVFTDPTENAVIQQRIMLMVLKFLQAGEWSEEEKSLALSLSTLISLKLVAIWAHLHRFKELEQQLIAEAKTNPQSTSTKPTKIENSQELYIEFDEFLVQVKSCLDYIAKFPSVVLGKQGWTGYTYGDKGQKIIKLLKNSTPKHFKNFALVLVKMVEGAEEWVSLTVDARDRVNHCLRGGIDINNFAVFAVQDGNETHIFRPRWNKEQPVSEMMDIVWGNLLCFTERFLASTAAAKLPSQLCFFVGPSEPAISPKSTMIITTVEEMRRVTSQDGWQSGLPEGSLGKYDNP